MEKFDIEKFPTSESAKRMLSYVSEDFYEKSYVGKWLYQIMGLEWDDAGRILKEELPKQFFPETATWGLMFHEIKWGLPIQQNLSYEERRKLLFQKMNYRMPMNPYQMEQYVKGVTGAEVCIADVNDPGIQDFKPDHSASFCLVTVSWICMLLWKYWMKLSSHIRHILSGFFRMPEQRHV